ncbi:glycosyltransferase [Synechococcus sp. CS-1327]|uniref:glycosyltransferase n=1 Tax=Synechococcus sp. CS-1327 TaxID=2847977 RepID=UPI00223B949A|nr:glycosyltransferase [Synechococcus sp. CS-1327]MCT0233000.1 glycosyltransferase [Synechococcus sp. CS-1327]
MHVGLIAPLSQPTPPATYGGVERVVAIHAAELLRQGHRVTLFAADGSALPGARVFTYGPAGIWPAKRHLARLVALLPSCRDLDLVHSFGRSLALLPWLLAPQPPLVQTYACPLSARSIALLDRLFAARITYTVPSTWMRYRFPGKPASVAVVPNSLPLEQYKEAKVQAAAGPLVFLGRFDPCKGLHTAIATAIDAGLPLLVAGGAFDAASRAYETDQIAPYRNHPLITFLGPVDDPAKQHLLANARALLFPIEWEEPFGIVMLEAMACGTPVIAFDRGAVPEVIEPGISGFIVSSQAEMVAAVGKLDQLDRRKVRASFSARFGAPAVTTAYLQHYQAVCP